MEINNALKEMNDYTDRLTDYVNELRVRAGDNKLQEFADFRRFPMEIVKSSDIFYIGDAVEMLLPSYLNSLEDFGVISETNKKPIFHNRYIIPIKDANGKILNLVGYNAEADERYIYGTARYYRRRETMYGLENLRYAYKVGWAAITEGITDTIRVRSLGIPNTFAMCGTHRSDFIMQQLDRCSHGIIKIPDRDAPGRKASKRWKCHRSITLNIFIKYKDIDEMCKESDDNISWVQEYLGICKDWLLSSTHKGMSNVSESITMM